MTTRFAGITFGRISTDSFSIHVNEHSDIRQWDYIIVDNILGQIVEMERDNNSLEGKVRVIGIPTDEGLVMPTLPVGIGEKVYRAKKATIKKAFDFQSKGAYLGVLHGYPDIKIHVDYNDLIQRHSSILGTTGSGKSSCARVIVEEFIGREPIIILDISGEYSTLSQANMKDIDKLLAFGITPKVIFSHVEEYTTVKKKGKKILKIDLNNLILDDIIGLNRKYSMKFSTPQINLLKSTIKSLQDERIDLAKKGVNWNYSIDDIKNKIESEKKHEATKSSLISILDSIGQMDIFTKSKKKDGIKVSSLLKEKKIHIINLSHLEEASERELIVSKILSDVHRLKKKELARGKVRGVILLLEEMHNWAPQQGATHCSDIIKKLITEGRKLGVSIIAISTRPQKINKDILSQCKTQLLFQVKNSTDLDWIKDSFESADKSLIGQLPMLKPGECLISGVGISPMRVKMRPPFTLHGGSSVNF
ncbi:MAG: ATP-binding protein [Candidatus Hodarchaeales archaeon]